MALWIFLHLLLFLIAAEATCPSTCLCTLATTSCRDSDLTALPANVNPQVQILDLSYNNFMTIPPNLSKFPYLETLILKHNKIDAVDHTALRGLNNLKELDLSNNNITKWADISPSFLLQANSLTILDLSHNSLKGFPNLSSRSLTTLNLINCSLNSMRNDGLSLLTNLTTLDMAHNKFNMLTVPFRSKSLLILNLTNCGIEEIHVNAFAELTNLQHLILAENMNLKNFHAVTSARKLDISDCNLESIPKSEMPNLLELNLHGNHLRRIEQLSFQTMPKLQIITLTNNAIDEVSPNGFVGLRNITVIDLSFNVISQLSPDLVRVNPNLQQLILSHNYLTELVPFVSKSLRFLDMSECEISNVEKESLVGMSELIHLNLSRNVFTAIPNNFSSDKLQTLDLGLCRITNLKNETFANMPKLKSLNLAGNRLVEIRHQYLRNVSLVRLSDNTWRCDCNSQIFRELFIWLTKVNSDAYQLTCQSPENLEGKFWYQACGTLWFIEGGNRSERAWLVVFIIILIMLFLFIIVIYTNRARKKKRERELQRLRDQAEGVERLRRLRMREESNVERNAPDPREAERPPSYNEAIAMPPLLAPPGNEQGGKAPRESNNNKRPKTRRKRRTRSRNAATTSRPQHDDGASTPAEVMESDV